jgi:hypothetical protein
LRTPQRIDERRTIEPKLHVNVVPGCTQTLEAGVGDFFGYKDPCHPSIVACRRCHCQLIPANNFDEGVIVSVRSTAHPMVRLPARSSPKSLHLYFS